MNKVNSSNIIRWT